MTDPAVRQVLQEALAGLEARRDRRRARTGQRFFKEPVPLYGIPAAELRKQGRALGRRLRRDWGPVEAARLADALVRQPELEAKALGLLVLAEFGPDLPDRLLPRLHSWLAWHCGNWATVDLLATRILTPLVSGRPELAAQLERWAVSPQTWVSRGGIVAFVALARRGRHLGAVYRIAESVRTSREEMVRKALGWLLREAGHADRGRLRAWLLAHGPTLPRLVVRAALEGFPAEERRRLLELTREGGRGAGSRRRHGR